MGCWRAAGRGSQRSIWACSPSRKRRATASSDCHWCSSNASKGDVLVKKSTTPTFLLELPLAVDAGQAKRLRAHFEAGRCLYNALLGEAMKRLRAMRADPA